MAKTKTPAPVRSRVSAPRTLQCTDSGAAMGAQCFWVNHGPILADINDLFRALDEMTDAQFAHHVMKGKNDFAAWVREVLGHAACAEKLTKSKTRAAARKAIADCCAVS